MREQIKPKDKRFVTIKRYCEITGVSYATADHMLRSGQLNYILTESGQRRIDIQSRADTDNGAVMKELERQGRMLAALCRQFNTSF